MDNVTVIAINYLITNQNTILKQWRKETRDRMKKMDIPNIIVWYVMVNPSSLKRSKQARYKKTILLSGSGVTEVEL